MRAGLAAAVLLFLSAGAVPNAGAEDIYMKDGSHFTGSVLSATTDYLGISVEGRTIQITKDSIRAIDYGSDWDGKSMREGEFIVKVGLGSAIPLMSQGFNNIAKTGAASEIEGIVQFDKHMGLGIRLDDSAYSVAYPNGTYAAGLGNGSSGPGGGLHNGFVAQSNVDVSSLVLELRYVALPEKRISPFAVAGAGIDAYYERQSITPKPNSGGWGDDGSYDPRVYENNSSGFAAEIGGGLQFLLSRHYLAEVAARWHYDTVDNQRFGFNAAQAVTILGALGFRF
jgi:hypothetical protein